MRGCLVGLVCVLLAGTASADDTLTFTTQTAAQIQHIFDEHVRPGTYRYKSMTAFPLRTPDPDDPKQFREESRYDFLVRRAEADVDLGFASYHGHDDEQLEM